MNCQQIRTSGGFAIVCGGRRKLSMAAKQLIEAQTKLIERTRKAITFHRELALQCRANGLSVLAREHDYVATCLEEKIGMQMRAFRERTLLDESM